MPSVKKPVVLQFCDLKELWTFAQQLSTKEMRITTWNKTLCFQATDADVRVAVTAYKAKIVEKMELQF